MVFAMLLKCRSVMTLSHQWCDIPSVILSSWICNCLTRSRLNLTYNSTATSKHLNSIFMAIQGKNTWSCVMCQLKSTLGFELLF